MRRWHAALVLLALSFGATDAFGADVGVVFGSDVNESFSTRLLRELQDLGCGVAREAGLVASSGESLVVRSREDEVEIYDVTDDGSLRWRWTSRSADPLKTAEEIRAVLLPLVEAPQPPQRDALVVPPQDVAPVAEKPAMAEAERATNELALSAGGGALFGTGGAGAAATASFTWFPRGWRTARASFGVGVGSLLEVAPRHVSATQGASELRAFFVGPEVVARYDLSSRFAASLGLGVWPMLLRVSGDATPPFTARDDSAWSLSPTAGARLGYRAGDIAIFVESRAGAVIPSVAVRFAGGTVEESNTWASLGAGAALTF